MRSKYDDVDIEGELDKERILAQLRTRIDAGGFAVALSGGGHRATLATLGALMAIVDRKLGPKIIQIASVSGGSITHAFVAQRCRLNEREPGGLDDIAEELASTIIRKGILTRSWIAVLLLAPVVLGIVAGGIFAALIVQRICLAVWIGILIFFTAFPIVFIANGLIVEWLLNRRYFKHDATTDNGRTRARLASLAGQSIDHVFCMTDLVLGLPVYASSQYGGMIWRRLRHEPRTAYKILDFQTFAAGQLSIAEVVRASAGFPGIAPRRMRIPPDPQIPLVAELPRRAFLADGGIWNNLGSHVLREDAFIGTLALWENGHLRPVGKAPADIPLLCVNGSAPLRPTRPWAFQIPGVALLRSLLQVGTILSANTVTPRVDSMRRAFYRRIWDRKRPDHNDPADLIVDLREIKDTEASYWPGTWMQESIRKTDPSVKDWERSAVLRIRSQSESVAKRDSGSLAYVLGEQAEPQGSFPVCGLADIEDWDALRESPAWKHLLEKENTGEVDAPTTLDRIEPALARRLIARGYVNTYLVSLFLAPLADGELDRLAKLPDRLDKIVGPKPN